MFQLPEVIIPLDIMHHVDHKIPRTLIVPFWNTNSTISILAKNPTKEFQQESVSRSKRLKGQFCKMLNEQQS